MLKSLLKKDLNIIKKTSSYRKNLIFIIVFIIVFSFIIGKEATGIMASVMLLSIPFGIHSEDERSGFLQYYKTLPIKESVLVKEKFLLNGIFSLIGLLFSLLIYLVMNIFGKSISAEDVFGLILSIIIMHSMYSIYIPLIYKYSPQKAPIMIFILVIIIIFLGVLIAKLFKLFGLNIENTLESISEIKVVIGSLLIALTINLVSYFSAIKVLKNKDF